MSAKARVGDVVAVDWFDAWCDHDETRESDWKESMPVTTYGVLGRDGDVVTVIGEPFPDGVGRVTTHIPHGMVVAIRRLV